MVGLLADEARFELAEGCCPSTVFKTVSFDRSDTHPMRYAQVNSITQLMRNAPNFT